MRSRGIACTFQPLKEGYRGWGYTLGVMKHVDGLKLDCFYEYMNWYTSGFQGAFIAREGYYSAQPENAKKFLTQAEWDYWYGGKPAATDICNPFGKLMEKAGNVRDGGAIWDRLGNIAVWNSVMDEDRYLTRRWNEFITSCQEIADAARCLHSHRQQRLADLHHLAAVQAEFRSEPHDRREGRRLRLRLRAVDDQAAWLRRAVGVLGLQSGIRSR